MWVEGLFLTCTFTRHCTSADCSLPWLYPAGGEALKTSPLSKQPACAHRHPAMSALANRISEGYRATTKCHLSCHWIMFLVTRKCFWWSLEKKTGLQRNDCFYLYLQCQIAYHKDHRSTSSTQCVVSGWSLPLCCREGPEQLVCG